MKTAHIILILSILILWNLPVYGSSLPVDIQWVMDPSEGDAPFIPYIQSDHFRWQWRPDTPVLYDRLEAMEGLIQAIQGPVGASRDVKCRRPDPVPLPGAGWMLASGVIALVGIRRRLVCP